MNDFLVCQTIDIETLASWLSHSVIIESPPWSLTEEEIIFVSRTKKKLSDLLTTEVITTARREMGSWWYIDYDIRWNGIWPQS